MYLFKKIKSGNKRELYIFGIKFTYHKKIYKKINYRTFDMLAKTIRQHLSILPCDKIDFIVGIPRSGIIPAHIIALFLNKKCFTLNEFLNSLNKTFSKRYTEEREDLNVLVVDDSCNSGAAINEVKNILSDEKYSKYTFKYCAPYVTKESKKIVDYWFEEVEQPRLFQWNYMNHSISTKCCFDLDGVLCVDPTEDENDDGEKYLNFIKNAKPLYIPQYEINSIVTSRLEKYRNETEKWLKNHGVRYKNLYMLDLATAKERQQKKCHAKFKASVYKHLKDTICFIESNPAQAKEIAKLSHKQCICISTDEYFEGE